MSSLTRRDALSRVAAIGGALTLTALGPTDLLAQGFGRTAEPQSGSQLPLPQQSGIQHIVVLMMENRSFDHFLGWLPNADGKTDCAASAYRAWSFRPGRKGRGCRTRSTTTRRF